MTERKRVYIVEHTVTERYYYDPDEIQEAFEYDASEHGSLADFIVATFELHDGSQFLDRFFYNDANPSVSTELVERWDDE